MVIEPNISLFRHYFYRKNFEKLSIYYNKMEKYLSNPEISDRYKMSIFNLLGAYYYEKSNHIKSKQFFQNSLNIINNLKLEDEKIFIIMNMISYEVYKDKYDYDRSLLSKLSNLYRDNEQRIASSDTIFITYRFLEIILCYYNKDLDKSEKIILNLINEHFEFLQCNPLSLFKTYDFLGKIYEQKKRYTLSNKYYTLAVKVANVFFGVNNEVTNNLKNKIDIISKKF